MSKLTFRWRRKEFCLWVKVPWSCFSMSDYHGRLIHGPGREDPLLWQHKIVLIGDRTLFFRSTSSFSLFFTALLTANEAPSIHFERSASFVFCFGPFFCWRPASVSNSFRWLTWNLSFSLWFHRPFIGISPEHHLTGSSAFFIHFLIQIKFQVFLCFKISEISLKCVKVLPNFRRKPIKSTRELHFRFEK